MWDSSNEILRCVDPSRKRDSFTKSLLHIHFLFMLINAAMNQGDESRVFKTAMLRCVRPLFVEAIGEFEWSMTPRALLGTSC